MHRTGNKIKMNRRSLKQCQYKIKMTALRLREKAAALTYEQKITFVGLIREHEKAILDKRTDHGSTVNKRKAWKQVTHAFNAAYPLAIPKNTIQLKRAWEYIRNKIKADDSQFKKVRATEGGSSPTPPKYDSLTEEVKKLLKFELNYNETQVYDELSDLPPSPTPQSSVASPPSSPIVGDEDDIEWVLGEMQEHCQLPVGQASQNPPSPEEQTSGSLTLCQSANTRKSEKQQWAGQECKQRWTATKSGQEAASKGKYRYADQTSFVKPFLRERETVTNLDDGADVSTVNMEVMEEDDVVSQKKQKCSDEDQSYVGENCSAKGSRCEVTPSRRPVKPSETASSVLMKYIMESDKGEKPSDPVDLFFQSVAATVKKFSPYNQNMCKSKVFSIVSEFEMTQILENISPAASPTP